MTDLTDELHLPDHDSVLDQAIPFDKVRWMLLLPDATWWPAELDACPTPERWPRVDRRTVFTIAREAGTTTGNRHFLVAALVWGKGTKAQSVHRRGKISANTSPTGLDACLDAALGVLGEEGAVQAYRALNNDQRIPYLGAAFFTKVLYFAGTASSSRSG